MHRNPASVALQELAVGLWGLSRARLTARLLEPHPPAIRGLVNILFGELPEPRKRAADVARRIVEARPEPLWPFADQIASLLAEIPAEESRTRWHLGIVVPRIAHDRAQRLRAARIMILLAEDPGNVVRCSAIEGLARLALSEPDLRGPAEEMVAHFLHTGTPAMKSRARAAARLLTRPR